MVSNDEQQIRYCEKCKKKTEQLKCGFGEVGSLSGNSRWRCLTCKNESIKDYPGWTNWIWLAILILLGLGCVYLLLGYYGFLPQYFYNLCTPPKWYC